MTTKRDYYVLMANDYPEGILYGTQEEVEKVRDDRAEAYTAEHPSSRAVFWRVYPFPITCCFTPPAEPDLQILVHASTKMFDLMQRQAQTLSEVLNIVARSAKE